MKFVKMNGNGNDFVIIDDRKCEFKGKESQIAKILCDRHFGIGGDGILIVRNSEIAQIQMVIINSDGSYASMCGNGIRCFAKYVWDNHIVDSNPIKIETGDGVKDAFLHMENSKVEKVTINMGKPSFDCKSIPANCEDEIVNKKIKLHGREYNITTMLMGVPHTIIFGNLDDFDINEGKYIEKYELFPEGTNVNFCEIVDKNKIKVKTWERGAGATLACGTGNCSSVIAANKLGFTGDKVEVHIPGGKLLVQIKENGVFMTGPALISFKGELEI
ncbi:diaminopimelate epimerase [Clostridium fermenticellae]|uniref:Diaminopimelate epimerase n=1 Tax=Clostridium fermenticellae TaxID=2068654 RepID=A0A386H4M3_9CLOT|nr:diaminopimelate epimerase [Clostridium fermenticellae]AYD40616.1 diaminopimelate epimerase [Clostridium fermenticellae]